MCPAGGRAEPAGGGPWPQPDQRTRVRFFFSLLGSPPSEYGGPRTHTADRVPQALAVLLLKTMQIVRLWHCSIVSRSSLTTFSALLLWCLSACAPAALAGGPSPPARIGTE